MDGGNDADEEVERHAIAFLQRRRQRFTTDAGYAELALRFVDELIVQVVEQLAVNAHRLHAVQDGLSRSL
jgi:hypothetical protein